MYPQDDKEFYKNVTALKNMDYGNLYSGINPKYEFQTAYSVLYLQEIIHDEDSSILKHFYNDGYTDEKIDVLMDKANRIDDWITENYLQTLYDIQRNQYPCLLDTDNSPTMLKLDVLFNAEKLLYTLLKLKTKQLDDITQADKFFAIDSHFFTTYLNEENLSCRLDDKLKLIFIDDLINASNKLYGNLKEQLHTDIAIEKFITNNEKNMLKTCKIILDKYSRNTSLETNNIDFSKETQLKSIESLNDKQNYVENKLNFTKDYQNLLQDSILQNVNPITKEIYMALKLNSKIEYSKYVATNFFNSYKQHMFIPLTYKIYEKLKQKYFNIRNSNRLDIYELINKDLTKNKVDFLKVIDTCVKNIDENINKMENLDEYLKPVLEKSTTIEEYIKQSADKYSDRKITNDILKQSSKFEELKGKTINLQKKIISSAIKKVKSLNNYLGR
ncbi:hypothetical protein [Megamonas funiformis]|mgnify:FL=1|jgi:hypothetical protein|uniref:Uncharacterized protein n=1 Tax=Megamonas funiformis TaxID=437897 RepID=A0AAW4U6L1_9FIRM|nr:hypothetical protein [Megamonas funiformis]MCB6828731.1 hypothetical protein [Megamonas funiformis]